MEGSKLALHPDMPATFIKIPKKMAPSLMKKFGSERFRGLTIRKNGFKRDSLFHGTYVVLLTDKEFFEILKKHEELHVLHGELSRSRNDIGAIVRETEGKKYCEAMSLRLEIELLDEILAYGITEWDKNKDHFKKRFSESPPSPDLKYCPIAPTPENSIKAVLKQLYAPRFAQYIADTIDDAGILPDCGIISRHMSKNVVDSAAADYFEDATDAGINAFKILYEKLPKQTVERIIISCGLTKKEFESGNYVGPVKELTEWAENGNYKKVLASIPENAR